MSASGAASLDDEQLGRLLDEQWDLSAASIELLGGEIDRTFRVVDIEGTTFCVKVREEAGIEFELELAALAHLSSFVHVDVPHLVRSASGEDFWRDGPRAVWVLRWLDGLRWADLPWRSAELANDLGRRARQLSDALASFEHPAAHRTHHWDLRASSAAIEQHRGQAATDRQRTAVERVLELLEPVEAAVAQLPQSVVHQDLNDHNVIVEMIEGTASIAGIIDFGDTLHSATITELAVAVAYSMLRTDHPLDTAAAVVAGWFGDETPSSAELDVIFPLALGRLFVNALTWSARSEAQPEYADARSRHTWQAIEQLVDIPFALAAATFAAACASSPATQPERSVLAASVPAISGPCRFVDLDPRRDTFDCIDSTNGAELLAVGGGAKPFAVRHDTVRLDLGADADGSGGPATVQLGMELHLDVGMTVVAPVPGTIVEAGPDRVVLAHGEVWSMWNGLDWSAAIGMVGHTLDAGDEIGAATTEAANVQLLTFAPAPGDQIPTQVRFADRPAWTQLSLDPTAFLGLVDEGERLAPLDDNAVRTQRNTRLASSQRYYYREPMTLVRSSGVTFVDSAGRHYLDAINNVTHVGHGNERVAAAAERQLRRLNTNSRFVYEQMGGYAERLAALLPDPLEVVFLVCTGSEANDLALRISRQVTGREDIMVVDGAYHGNTTAVTGISPNRYKGAGGQGPPPTTHEVAQPNRYRGPHGHGDPLAGTHYAESVRTVANRLVAEGRSPAAFIAESLMGTAGQVVYPPGYLAEAFAAVRAVGGLSISDEVQVGFGRLGTHFWGFEQGGVVPDIVTMGKPMGNGHPIAAVVTTREIADAFDQGMKYFNTFGGNPVSCAIAGAVLDEIEAHDLQAHALRTGERFLGELRGLMDRHERIGDVRGEGLYLGVEFVADRVTKEPLTALTSEICERMRERGVIVYPNGVLGNCLKIKPPMPFDDGDTDQFVQTLELVLNELPS